ncbi:MAG: YebC/PmpR family DNA-binding transcriptional regulator [Holophagaceae bacterium]|nr:YebC/PmpR family DNA-binding transcriptional regulator [Holophagaceae bacterium]
MSGHSKWSTIKHKKGAADAKRGKLWTKLLKEISVAARLGGSDIDSNPRLRLAVDQAKAANMPKDNYERAIKKGAGELDGVTYEEVVYEAYGPGGVAFLIEALTDNKNRTTPEVRSYFAKFGGDLGTQGSVGYLFSKQGQIVLEGDIPEEKIMEIALESGAEDVVNEDEIWVVTTSPDTYIVVKEAIDNAKMPIIESKIIMAPSTETQVPEDKIKSFLKLIDMLEDNDDIQNVWHNGLYEESLD